MYRDEKTKALQRRINLGTIITSPKFETGRYV